MLIYWEYKHFSVLFADDNETLGKLINALGINNKKRIMPHLLDEGDPAKMKEYGFIKAVKHQGSVYVVIHKGFKIRCSSVVEAICRATMMLIIFHLLIPVCMYIHVYFCLIVHFLIFFSHCILLGACTFIQLCFIKYFKILFFQVCDSNVICQYILRI